MCCLKAFWDLFTWPQYSQLYPGWFSRCNDSMCLFKSLLCLNTFEQTLQHQVLSWFLWWIHFATCSSTAAKTSKTVFGQIWYSHVSNFCVVSEHFLTWQQHHKSRNNIQDDLWYDSPLCVWKCHVSVSPFYHKHCNTIHSAHSRTFAVESVPRLQQLLLKLKTKVKINIYLKMCTTIFNGYPYQIVYNYAFWMNFLTSLSHHKKYMYIQDDQECATTLHVLLCLFCI